MRSLLRWLALAYGLSTTLLFAATAIYAVGFIANLGLPKTIDSGPAGPTAHALPINVLLIALFAVQHSLMARQGFKRVWARIVPPPVERSTYVLCACLCLLLLFWLWQPMPAIVWSVEQPLLRLALHATFWSGWVLVLIAAMLTNSLELVGLRQIWDWCAGRAAGELSLPRGCRLVGCELVDDAVDLPSFRHPLQAAYVFGPERSSLSPAMLARCHHVVRIPTRFCINLAVAGAVVMYDRVMSLGRFPERPLHAGGPVEGLAPHVHGPSRRYSRRVVPDGEPG